MTLENLLKAKQNDGITDEDTLICSWFISNGIKKKFDLLMYLLNKYAEEVKRG